SQVLTCDRTRHRFRVTDPDALTHWIRVRRSHPWALDLETAPGARLMHWWVATVPVPVIYDPVTTGPRP
ncbi:hypothetical protein, partial [Nocardioides sp. ChNu-99]|uniref:hypothetical protein n=1 Tax=Nocardioides sp. ChNu-99 TaxID=2839897 RepID=UPI0024058E63